MTRKMRWGAYALLVLFLAHVLAVVGVAVAERDEHPGQLVATAIVVAVFVALLVARPLRVFGSRVVAAASTPEELPEPPSGRHPAIVALLVADRMPGLRLAVAATVLRLLEREQLRLDALDAERFELTVEPMARGEEPVEWYVIQNLRGGASREQGRTVDGPPLWRSEMWRSPRLGTFERDLRRMAMNAKLLAPVLSGLVLFVLPLALGVCLVTSGSGAAIGVRTWGFSIGPIIGMGAASLLGTRRTAAGAAEAARWEAHGRWLERSANLDDVGVPAFLVWGGHLTNAVATGVAMRAARALAPDWG